LLIAVGRVDQRERERASKNVYPNNKTQ